MCDHVDLFIPKLFLQYVPCQFYGTYRFENDSLQVHLMCLYQRDISEEVLSEKLKELVGKDSLGLCHGTFGKTLTRPLGPSFYDGTYLSMNINWDMNEIITVNRFELPGSKSITNPSITTILYDSQDVFDKELLLTCNNTFIDFLNTSHKKAADLAETERAINFPKKLSQSKLNGAIIFVLRFLFFPFNYGYEKFWFSQNVSKFINISATGRQINNNFRKYSEIYKMIGDGKISLMCGNLLIALAFDVLSGLYLTRAFHYYFEVHDVVDNALDKTDMLVNSLQDLLHWLMGVPAGLKLNRPLNTVCGRFFLYHIYLWKTYIVVLQPYLPAALSFSLNFGIFGTSFLLSLISDFVSLATMHIYFFYSYAARLYDFKVTSCICLWRLFRGKKWNPLRNRVDSYHYDVQQLFIGTLMFTIVVFLLPTVVVYYFVFTLLRLVILLFMTAMTKMIDVIATLPIYVMVLQLFRHNSINGDIYFETISHSGQTLTMSMKGIPVSWRELFNRTLPKSKETTNLALGMLIRSLIRGNIIYPW